MQATVNGFTMAYDDAGSGPAVVLIHGYPLGRRMWRPQVAALTAAGYRVVAPDLRGFGESEVPPGEWTVAQMADDVAALLDRLGIASAAVAGMSMGGYVLLELLARHRRRVAAALFVVTRAGADDEPGRMRRTALAREVAGGNPAAVTGAFEGILFAPGTVLHRPELVAEVRGWMEATDPGGLVGGLLAMRDRRDASALLPTFDLPALVVGAEQDRAIPAEHAALLAAGLPRAELRLLPEGGHMVNLEAPEPFNGALLAFLGEHLRP